MQGVSSIWWGGGALSRLLAPSLSVRITGNFIKFSDAQLTLRFRLSGLSICLFNKPSTPNSDHLPEISSLCLGGPERSSPSGCSLALGILSDPLTP